MGQLVEPPVEEIRFLCRFGAIMHVVEETYSKCGDVFLMLETDQGDSACAVSWEWDIFFEDAGDWMMPGAEINFDKPGVIDLHVTRLFAQSGDANYAKEAVSFDLSLDISKLSNAAARAEVIKFIRQAENAKHEAKS